MGGKQPADDERESTLDAPEMDLDAGVGKNNASTDEPVLSGSEDGLDGDLDTDTVEGVDLPPVLEEVVGHFQGRTDDFTDPPEREFVAEEWFDLDYRDEHEEVTRHWVQEPYAYVAIVENPRRGKYHYRVVEPVLSPFEEYVRDNLVKSLRNSLMYQPLAEDDDREEVFAERAREALTERAAATIPDGSLHKLYYYLVRDFVHLGPIEPIMRDPAIEDVSCDGVDVPVYVYHGEHRDLRTNVTFDRRELSSFALRLAQRAGEQLSVSEPLVDGSLPDGSRVQLTFESDVATKGSNFTIRKFATTPYTPVELVRWDTFSLEQMAYFWLAIENNRSLIFSGGTGSGKTTSMNAVSFFIPEDSKVVSIEDTREITLPHENWVPSLARNSIDTEGRGEISMYELLQAALRQRPEYLLVGEIRTQQQVAFTFFQAIGTGHTAYTTIHADTVEGVLNRLENPPLSVPTQMIQDLDIVSIQKQTFQDGERVRRNQQVTEILPPGGAGEGVRTIDVFERDAEADTIQQVNNSTVLDEIAEARGWSGRRLNEELSAREEVLEYLLEEDLTDFDSVTATIDAFGTNREEVLDGVHAGTFSPTEFHEDIEGAGP